MITTITFMPELAGGLSGGSGEVSVLPHPAARAETPSRDAPAAPEPVNLRNSFRLISPPMHFLPHTKSAPTAFLQEFILELPGGRGRPGRSRPVIRHRPR